MTNVDRFRSVMRTTGSFITGDFTIAFFTGDNLPDYIEIFFDQEELKSHLRSWFKFFKQEDKIGEGLKIMSNGAEKFVNIKFDNRHFILRFGNSVNELTPYPDFISPPSIHVPADEWTVSLPTVETEMEDDGYDGSDEEEFWFYLGQSFFEALEEEKGNDTYTFHWNSGDDDEEYYSHA